MSAPVHFHVQLPGYAAAQAERPGLPAGVCAGAPLFAGNPFALRGAVGGTPVGGSGGMIRDVARSMGRGVRRSGMDRAECREVCAVGA